MHFQNEAPRAASHRRARATREPGPRRPSDRGPARRLRRCVPL